jgi:hypothetical protein
VHQQRAGLLLARQAPGQRLGVGGALHMHGGAQRRQRRALGGAGHLGQEDLAAHAQRARRGGHRDAGVAARGHHHARIAGTGSERMRLNMPRALKLPPTCRCSSFSQTSARSRPSARPGRRHSGVRRTSPAMRAAAADALAWAQRLVRFNTVSDQSNRALIDCIADHLRSLGVQPRLTHDAERRKFNLFATLGEGKPAGVILSGHTDTVPWTGQAWTTDPLGAECATAGCTAAAAPT